MNIIKSNLYDAFHCTGSECTDTCCAGWSISLTKKEYLDYKKMKCSPELRARIDGAFKRNRNENLNAYVTIKLNEHDKCPILDDSGLCSLQKELGEKVLSRTCRIFPRYYTAVGKDTYILSVIPSCYHVAELMMKLKDGLILNETKHDGSDDMINRRNYNSKMEKNEYNFQIIGAGLDILQDRRFSMDERMLLLGFFMYRADKLIAEGKSDKLPSTIALMNDGATASDIIKSLSAPEHDTKAVGSSVNTLRVLDQSTNYPKIIVQRLQIRQTFIDGQFVTTWNKDEYFQACERYREFERQNPHFIENLMANLFMYYHADTPLEEKFMYMAAYYNAFKISLGVGLGDFDDQKSLMVYIGRISRTVTNSTVLKTMIIPYMQSHETGGLAAVAYIIKA